jgi:hypothetical protein
LTAAFASVSPGIWFDVLGFGAAGNAEPRVVEADLRTFESFAYTSSRNIRMDAHGEFSFVG